jgi:hypothetical protein
MEKHENLWPDFGSDKIITPSQILKEQASNLGKKTNNIVVAKVLSKTVDFAFSKIGKFPFKGEGFKNDFYIVAPALDNYSYKLFSIYYDFNLFPVCIEFKERPVGALYLPVFVQVKDEQELLAELKNIFEDSHTVTIIRTLLAQSN